MSHSQNPILWVSTSSKWQIRQCLYALKTLKLKSPRLTRSGPRRYAGHTSGSTSLRTPGMEWVYQVWRKSQFKLVTFFCHSGAPERSTSYLNHQISLCSKQLQKTQPRHTPMYSSHLISHPSPPTPPPNLTSSVRILYIVCYLKTLVTTFYTLHVVEPLRYDRLSH